MVPNRDYMYTGSPNPLDHGEARDLLQGQPFPPATILLCLPGLALPDLGDGKRVVSPVVEERLELLVVRLQGTFSAKSG